jgi:hypothetical protein
MGKAVKHSFACGNFRDCQPVVLLVKKKARLLPVYIVYIIKNAVFGNQLPA